MGPESGTPILFFSRMVRCGKCNAKAHMWQVLTGHYKSEGNEDADSDDYAIYDDAEHSTCRMFQCRQCFTLCTQRLKIAAYKGQYPVIAGATYSMYLAELFDGPRPAPTAKKARNPRKKPTLAVDLKPAAKGPKSSK